MDIAPFYLNIPNRLIFYFSPFFTILAPSSPNSSPFLPKITKNRIFSVIYHLPFLSHPDFFVFFCVFLCFYDFCIFLITPLFEIFSKKGYFPEFSIISTLLSIWMRWWFCYCSSTFCFHLLCRCVFL